MAAVFPLDTTKPWTFNGVTYEYDATEDRWFVISTNKTDLVDDNLDTLNREVDVLNTVIDQEIENRTNLLNVAANKNNDQDAAISELDGRVDALGTVIGALEFKGRYRYVLEKSSESCDAAYIACLAAADAGDNPTEDRLACNRAYTDCSAAIGQPLETGTFTSVGTINQKDAEELVISLSDLDGLTFDWENLLEIGDYIELVEEVLNDTVLYQVISDPTRVGTEERIRVKHIKETGEGDGNFNIQEISQLRVIKQSVGLDPVEADKRYQVRPYTVLFSDAPPSEGGAEDTVLRNGELWYDTETLELFVWNNNAWVAAAKPPSQDITVLSMQQQIDTLTAEAFVTNQTLNTLVTETESENNIYYSDNTPTGDISGTLRNGDIWIDSDDLTIKFYSGGAWINPDRSVTNPITKEEIYSAPPGRQFQFHNGTTVVAIGGFNYYESGGVIYLRLHAIDALGKKWWDGGIQKDIDYSDGPLFRITREETDGTHKTIRMGRIRRIDYHEDDILCYTST